jgi:hypothetical protein
MAWCGARPACVEGADRPGEGVVGGCGREGGAGQKQGGVGMKGMESEASVDMNLFFSVILRMETIHSVRASAMSPCGRCLS